MQKSRVDGPKVSIGMPVYNGERYLAPALDSLLAQTFGDFELIVCDNASTDATGEIAEHYAQRDNRVRYVREPRNTGAVRNHNRTIELSTGEYFKWAAHDDLYAPQFVERCVELLDASPEAVLAYSRTQFIDEQGQILGDYRHPLDLATPLRAKRFLQYVAATHVLVEDYGLIRNHILKKTPLLGNYAWSDMVLFGELALHGTFIEAPEVLFYRREHLQRMMQAHKDPKSLTVFNDPAKKGERVLPLWRVFGGHLGSLQRVSLPFSEKIALAAGIARRANWTRGRLASELWSAVRPNSSPAP